MAKFKVSYVANGVTVKGTAEAADADAVRAALAAAVVSEKKVKAEASE